MKYSDFCYIQYMCPQKEENLLFCYPCRSYFVRIELMFVRVFLDAIVFFGNRD
jgi:hypothetical protein